MCCDYIFYFHIFNYETLLKNIKYFSFKKEMENSVFNEFLFYVIKQNLSEDLIREFKDKTRK